MAFVYEELCILEKDTMNMSQNDNKKRPEQPKDCPDLRKKKGTDGVKVMNDRGAASNDSHFRVHPSLPLMREVAKPQVLTEGEMTTPQSRLRRDSSPDKGSLWSGCGCCYAKYAFAEVANFMMLSYSSLLSALAT